MSTENRLLQPAPGASSDGFDAVMDSIDSLTDDERAALALQADQAQLGHEAYALGLELLALDRREQALHWLRTAARYQVTGAQLTLRPRNAPAMTEQDAPRERAHTQGREAEAGGTVRPSDSAVSPAASAPSAGSAPEPHVQQLILGALLRDLRIRRNLTLRQVALSTLCSVAGLSRFERGDRLPQREQLDGMLTLYGVDSLDERRRILKTWQAADRPSWWHEYRDIMPPWLQSLFDLERSADLIKTFEARIVPGLLQTPEYAKAIMRTGMDGGSDQEIDRRVQLRMKRQQLLHAADGPKLWAILDESVLRRQVGGSAVMGEQLRHLVDMASRPNLTIQVLPMDAHAYGDVGAPVTVMRFAERSLPDVVYLEQLSGGQYLRREDDNERYRHLLNHLAAAAEEPDRTEGILHRILEHADTGPESSAPNADTTPYTSFMEQVADAATPPDHTARILGGYIAACG
ncbi:helix-turn-helix domain-containing protein [Streptomyces sp. NPDC101178]|uniref:helix-turn-helix domain-containing protein n=1 Tax=Streptomyces sp. NPDC101178 TaxID=3366124 RepID=UPI00382F54DF